MQSRGKALKLTAVAVLVVVSLTGFSDGRGRGGSSGGGSGGKGGGGGCSSSSSSQNHSSSSGRKSDAGSGGGSHRYGNGYGYGNSHHNGNDEESNGGSGGNHSSSLRDATVKLLGCASKKTPYATVEVTNPNAVDGVFTVTVVFEKSAGAKGISRSRQVEVAADDTATARVPLNSTGRAPRITGCTPAALAPAR